MPKIPKLSAITNEARHMPLSSDDTGSKLVEASKSLRSDDTTDTMATPRSSKPSHNISKCYKFHHTAIRTKAKVPVASSKRNQRKTTKFINHPPVTGMSAKKLIPPVNIQQEEGEDKTTDIVQIAPPSDSDVIDIVDQPANSEEGVAFTLSLDPSDCSDIDTDASASSTYISKRLEDCSILL